MNTNEQLKKETMGRIYMIFFMKKLYGRVAIKIYALAGLVLLQSWLVSIKNVITNMPAFTDLSAMYNFYSYAFLNTQMPVQVALVASFAVGLWLFRDLL